MTASKASDGSTVWRLGITEKIVGSVLGALVVAGIGFICSQAWIARDTLRDLVVEMQFARGQLGDHEVRIRVLEKGPRQ